MGSTVFLNWFTLQKGVYKGLYIGSLSLSMCVCVCSVAVL